MPQCECALKARARYQHRGAKETPPDSPSPPRPDARQSKTKRAGRLTEQRSRFKRYPSRRRRVYNRKLLRPFKNTRKRREHDEHVLRAQAGARHSDRRQHGHRLRHRRAAAHDRNRTLLLSARAELAAATPNKGGHRERALGLIDQAIGEVRAGIAFAGS
jgi:hypothetical protein